MSTLTESVVAAIQAGAIRLDARGELELDTQILERIGSEAEDVCVVNESVQLGLQGDEDNMKYTRRQLSTLSKVVKALTREGKLKPGGSLDILIEGGSLAGTRLQLRAVDDKKPGLDIVVRDGVFKEAADAELDDANFPDDEIKVVIHAPNPDAVKVEVEGSEEVLDLEDDAEDDLEDDVEGLDELEEPLEEGVRIRPAPRRSASRRDSGITISTASRKPARSATLQKRAMVESAKALLRDKRAAAGRTGTTIRENARSTQSEEQVLADAWRRMVNK